jgi:hypothetical protein
MAIEAKVLEDKSPLEVEITQISPVTLAEPPRPLRPLTFLAHSDKIAAVLGRFNEPFRVEPYQLDVERHRRDLRALKIETAEIEFEPISAVAKVVIQEAKQSENVPFEQAVTLLKYSETAPLKLHEQLEIVRLLDGTEYRAFQTNLETELRVRIVEGSEEEIDRAVLAARGRIERVAYGLAVTEIARLQYGDLPLAMAIGNYAEYIRIGVFPRDFSTDSYPGKLLGWKF